MISLDNKDYPFCVNPNCPSIKWVKTKAIKPIQLPLKLVSASSRMVGY